MRLTPRSPSRRGAGEPEVTKAAVVSGTRPAARRRSKDQWYEPCDLDGGGKVVGSFTVPLYIAKKNRGSSVGAGGGKVGTYDRRERRQSWWSSVVLVGG